MFQDSWTPARVVGGIMLVVVVVLETASTVLNLVESQKAAFTTTGNLLQIHDPRLVKRLRDAQDLAQARRAELEAELRNTKSVGDYIEIQAPFRRKGRTEYHWLYVQQSNRDSVTGVVQTSGSEIGIDEGEAYRVSFHRITDWAVVRRSYRLGDFSSGVISDGALRLPYSIAP